MPSNLMKQFSQLDEKCFKWCFNLVLSLPGSRLFAVNCPSLSSGSLGKAHLWCMGLIFRKAGALTHGACWIELSCLKRLLSPAVPPDSLQGVWQKNWWQCQENAEAWLTGVAVLGVVICPVKWDLWQCGQLETNILSCCCQIMEEAWTGAYGQTALLKVPVLMEISLSDLFVPLPHQLCQQLLCSVLKKQNPCWCSSKRVAWKQAFEWLYI